MKHLLKKLYYTIPLKKEMFQIVNTFWTPPEKIFKHLFFKGKFRVKLKNNASFLIKHYGYQIENEIFWKGINNAWEKNSFNIWAKLCEDANIIVDIGANTGIYSLIAKAINPGSKVYAFEPVDRVFAKLEENIDLNDYDVKCIKKAASNFDGKATIYDTSAEHTLSVTVNKNLLDSDRKDVIECTIDTIKVSTFIEANGIESIDLIKIDVETHEPEVLEGFGVYLKEFHPTMLIEILSDEMAARIEKIISGLNYLYFNIDENKGFRQVDRLTKSDYFNFLLCSYETAKKIKLI